MSGTLAWTETHVCLTTQLCWLFPWGHKYHGVRALGACGVCGYAVQISPWGWCLKCFQKARGFLCFYVLPSAGRPGSARGPLGTECRCESQAASWHSGWECDSACLADEAKAAGDRGPHRGRGEGGGSSGSSFQLHVLGALKDGVRVGGQC